MKKKISQIYKIVAQIILRHSHVDLPSFPLQNAVFITLYEVGIIQNLRRWKIHYVYFVQKTWRNFQTKWCVVWYDTHACIMREILPFGIFWLKFIHKNKHLGIFICNLMFGRVKILWRKTDVCSIPNYARWSIGFMIYQK